MKTVRPVSECCPEATGLPLSSQEAERLASAFRVLADPARLRVLSLLASQPDGGACVGHLTDPLGLTQPTVSHHLKVLHDAGLVSRERQGVWVCYRVLPEGLDALADVLRALAPAQVSR